MSKGYKELSFKINAELNPDSVSKIQKTLDNKQATINLNLDFKDLDSTLKKLNSKLDRSLSSGTDKLTTSLKTSKLTAEQLSTSLQSLSRIKIDKAIADLKQFKLNNGTSESIEKAIKDLDELKSKISSVSKEELTFKKYSEFKSQIQDMTAKVTTFKKEAKLDIDTSKFDASIKNSAEKVETNINKIKQEIRGLDNLGFDTSKMKSDLNTLESSFKNVNFDRVTKSLDAEMKQLSSSSDKMAKEVSNNLQKLNKANLKGLQTELRRTDGFFREFINNFSAYSLADITADLIQDGIRTGIDSILGVDSGLNEVMMVAPPDFRETEANLESLKAKIFEIGKTTGQTFEDTSMNIKRAIMSGISDMNTAIEVGNLTSILSNVSDLTQEEASSSLVSVRGAFKMTTDQLNDAVDQLNHAGNNYSSSTGDVANAIAVAGGVLNQAGASFNESIGMFLAGNHTLQDGDKVANGIKTIATNLKGVSYNAKSGKVELNKVGKALKNIAGIDVYTDKTKTQVKDTFQLLDELQTKWVDGSLTQAQKLSLAETIAGKHRIAVLQSIIDNWEIAKQYQDDYNEGSYIGSAEKENERFTNSLAGKINRLKMSIGELFNTLVDSGVVGSILDGLSTFIEKLTVAIQKLSDSGNLLPTLVGGFQALTTVLKGLAGFGIGSVVGGAISSAIGSSGGLKSLAKDLGSVATKGGLLAKVVASLSGGFVTLGIAAATGLGGYAIVKGLSNLKREADLYGELKNEVKETIAVKEDELKALKTVTDAELKRYDELNKKRLKAKKSNESLSKDELAEYQSLVNKIGEVAPQLVEGYDELGNAILVGGDKLGQVSEEFRAKTDQVIGDLEIQKRKLAKLSFEDRNQERSRGAFLKRETYDESMERSLNDYIKDTHKAEVNLSKASEKLVTNLSKSDSQIDTINALKKYSESLNKHNQKIESTYAEYVNQYNEMADSRANLQQYIKESVELSDAYDRLNDLSKNGTDDLKKTAKDSMQTLQNLFKEDLIDWSKVGNVNELDRIIENITSKIGEKGELPQSLVELEQAYANFDKDKNIDKLREKLAELKPALSQDLGISENKLSGIIELPKYLQMAEDSLDDYLQRRGSDYSHLNSSDEALRKKAEQLKNEYNALMDLAEILSDGSNISLDGNFFNEKELLKNFSENSNLSENVKKAITQLLNDTNGINIPIEKLGLVIDYITATELGTHNTIEDALQYMINLEESGYPVKINLEPFFENSTSLSQEYKDMISKLGELDKDQANAVLKITGKLQLNEELDLRDVVHLQKVINEQLGENTIDILATLKDEQFREESRNLLNSIRTIAQENNIELTTSLDQDSLKEIKNNLSFKEKDLFNTHIELPIDATLNFNHVSEVANTLNRTPINMALNLDDSELLELQNESKTTLNKSVRLDVDDSGAKDTLQAFAHMGNLTKLRLAVEDNGTTDQVQSKINNITSSDKKVDVNVTDNGTTDEIQQKVNAIGPVKQPEINVTDNGSVSRIQSKINSIKDKTVTVTVQQKIAGAGLVASNLASSIIGRSPRTIEVDTPPQVARMSSLLSVDTASAYNEVATFTNDMQSRVSSASSDLGVSAVNPLARASKWTPTSILTGSVDYLRYSIDLQAELEAILNNIGSQLDILSEKFELAYGKDKISNLEQQNKLLKEQMAIQKKLESSLKKEQSDLKKFLSSKGIKFDKDGNTTNWTSILTKLEKEVASLEAKANKSGSTSDQRKYEQKKQYLDDLKKAVERYVQITTSELPDAQKEWLALQNAINSNLAEIEELKESLVFDIQLDKLQSLNTEFSQLSSKLDIINSKLQYANGEEKVELLKKQIELLKKQAELSLQIQNQKIEDAKALKDELAKEGFKFDADGLITNYESIMKKLEKYVNNSKTNADREKREKEVEKIKESLEDYLELISTGIPNAQKEWLELQNSIKDANKQMLETTKTIEDKITDVYRKQVEERKKLINDELDKRKSALDEQQKMYNNLRNEQDKEKEIKDQQDILDKLQKQIVEASKDNSTSGKANLNKLMEEYQKELEKMDSIIQSQTDDKINDLFDKQKELLEQQAKLEEERLDDKYSEENLKQIVKDVILSGVIAPYIKWLV